MGEVGYIVLRPTVTRGPVPAEYDAQKKTVRVHAEITDPVLEGDLYAEWCMVDRFGTVFTESGLKFTTDDLQELCQ